MLKKILTPFILPPGIFFLILIFLGIRFISRKSYKAGFANIIIACLMWFVSTFPVSNTLFIGLESQFHIPKDPRGDVIILLGGGIHDTTPDMTGIGTPSSDMTTRIITAVRLQKRLGIPFIVSGGTVFDTKQSEAAVAKRFLVDLGVPFQKIILEERSRDTFENAKYSREICEKAGFKNPILITNAFHMKRSVMSFEKAGIKVLPFPAGFRSDFDEEYTWHDFLPGDYGDVSVALKEYLGLLFYRYAY